MKFQKRLIGAATGCLLLGASNVMADELNIFEDIWVYAGVQSSSGTVDLDRDPADFCMQAVGDLRGMGFEFKAAMQLEPRISALYFEKPGDAATLFCAQIREPRL
jgi:hypothetical protein